MPSAKVTTVQTNFTSGEISERALGRFDIDKYANAVKRMENYLPFQLGGAMYRPGTRYIAEIKDSDARARLLPFQYNVEQAYMLELGDEYMRFFANRGQVILPATDPLDSYTKLLSHFDGTNGQASYTPEVGPAISFFGDSQLDTSQKKFGVSSLRLDGTGDYVKLADHADFDFGTGNATIDFWVRFNSLGIGHYIVSRGSDNSTNGYLIEYSSASGGLLVVSIGGATILSRAWVPTTGVWYHVEWIRSGTDNMVFVDGTKLGATATDGTDITYATDLYIGTSAAGTRPLDGWIDEFRISKGIARHTATFTPATSAYGGAVAWVTATAYDVGDYVNQGGTVYICLIAHTSGVFATDLAALRWEAQTVLEVPTPYAVADVPRVQLTQNADTAYFFHPDYPTYKLQRVSATEFTFAEAPFVRGPFLDANITAVTITPSSATGSTTLTASSALFLAGHIGSLWKVNNAVVKITGFTSTTVVTGTVQAEPDGTAGNIGGTTAYTAWAEGALSAVRGYASTGVFFGQCLVIGGTSYKPQHFYATNINAFDNFKTNSSDETAAYTYQATSEQANVIRWLASAPKALQLGTSGGMVSAGVNAGTITNANPPEINTDSSYGALPIQPKKASSLLYYIQRNGFNLRELSYNYLQQRSVAGDMNLLADHILRDGGGAYAIDYQQSPQDRIWVLRNDGQLAVLTRNVEQQVMGWARIIAGSDATGAGVIESVAVIQQDSSDDEVWVIVKRTINGVTKRFVEYFMPEIFDEDWDSVNLDCSLTLDSPMTITGATKANPVVITALSHGFSNGDQVKIDGVVGMTDLNGNSYLIANKTLNTFELQTVAAVNVNGTAYGTYRSGGEVRKMVTAITGLSHLNGEIVSVQADGVCLSSTFTVSSGAITLADKAAVVHVGLPYTDNAALQLLDPGDLNTQFKNRRFYLSSFRVDRSLGFKIGQDESNMRTISVDDLLDDDEVLYTGDIEDMFTSYWEKRTEIIIKPHRSNPLFISAISLRSELVEKD